MNQQLQGVTYKFEEQLPSNHQEIQVLNPREEWIGGLFMLGTDGDWTVEFDADDLAPKSEILKFFPVWRVRVIKTMTKEVIPV